jgi:hypothetical protein
VPACTDTSLSSIVTHCQTFPLSYPFTTGFHNSNHFVGVVPQAGRQEVIGCRFTKIHRCNTVDIHISGKYRISPAHVRTSCCCCCCAAVLLENAFALDAPSEVRSTALSAMLAVAAGHRDAFASIYGKRTGLLLRFIGDVDANSRDIAAKLLGILTPYLSQAAVSMWDVCACSEGCVACVSLLSRHCLKQNCRWFANNSSFGQRLNWTALLICLDPGRKHPASAAEHVGSSEGCYIAF